MKSRHTVATRRTGNSDRSRGRTARERFGCEIRIIPIPDKNCFSFYPELESLLPKQTPKP
jgi:hypothetical protein